MATYLFRCPDGHETELVMSMREEIPPGLQCTGGPVPGMCLEFASRVFLPPIAIHFKGSGFYTTDVTSKLHRKRRKNPGDKLAPVHDPQAAYIAKHL